MSPLSLTHPQNAPFSILELSCCAGTLPSWEDVPMLTAIECRRLAKTYRDRANEIGIHPRTANVLKNIASSFSGLASQFEILMAIEEEQLHHCRAGGENSITTRPSASVHN